MKEKNITIPMLILGAVGLVTGVIVGKIQERKLEKQLESDRALHQQLQEYADELETATDRYRAEIEETSKEVKELLSEIEASEQEEES